MMVFRREAGVVAWRTVVDEVEGRYGKGYRGR